MVFVVISMVGAFIFAIIIPLVVMMYIDIATINAQTKAERKVLHNELIELNRLKKQIEADRQKGNEEK
jgi:hypothetical protein